MFDLKHSAARRLSDIQRRALEKKVRKAERALHRARWDLEAFDHERKGDCVIRADGNIVRLAVSGELLLLV